jgi:hypothetical protein
LFRLFMACARRRNYGDDAAVVRLWLLRFDVEACRHFHPAQFRASWLERAKVITRQLSLDTIAMLRTLGQHVRTDAPSREDGPLGTRLAARVAAIDREVIAAADELAREMTEAVGQEASLREVRRAIEHPVLLAAPFPPAPTRPRGPAGDSCSAARVEPPRRPMTEVHHE